MSSIWEATNFCGVLVELVMCLYLASVTFPFCISKFVLQNSFPLSPKLPTSSTIGIIVFEIFSRILWTSFSIAIRLLAYSEKTCFCRLFRLSCFFGNFRNKEFYQLVKETNTLIVSKSFSRFRINFF